MKLILILLGPTLFGQNWSGILKPTSGTGSCSYGSLSAAGQCAVDWTAVGIPGGIPSGSWTQSGSTITATSGDRTSTIQTALNSCGTNHYVLLGSGSFSVTTLSIPSNCVLRGAGPQNTIVIGTGTSGSIINMGTYGDSPYIKGTSTINSGATAGSTQIVLAATTNQGAPGPFDTSTGLSVGGYLLITELNDPVYVSAYGIQNTVCSYCDGIFSGTRMRGQVVEITSYTGTGPYTVNFTPPLYTDYGVAAGTGPAWATPFGVVNGGQPNAKYAGIENLQIFATGSGITSGMSNITMTECAYCWIKNIESNYTDADHVDISWGYRNEIRDSYFSNGFGHGAGTSENTVMNGHSVCCTLIENNILERTHGSLVTNWGTHGSVYAYNFCTSSYDAVGYNAAQLDLAANHGAHPQFNLYEGNVCSNWEPDDFHGTSSHQTLFRTWLTADTFIAPYPNQAMSSGTCSGGTCTITWASGTSTFYAGTYLELVGTSQSGCHGQTFHMAGSAGSLSSTFSGAGSCVSWTGGNARTYDLAAYPAPITHQAVQWGNGHHPAQQQWGVVNGWANTNNNIIGNIIGSAEMTATGATAYNGGSAPCTSCVLPPTTTTYGGQFYAFRFGYDTNGDPDGSGVATLTGGPSNSAGYWAGKSWSTAFLHGNYDIASASTMWDIHASGNHTLPPSFLYNSRPSWFRNIPWPPIGPDVSGGIDAAGHVYAIPTMACYNNTSKDAAGLIQFDANSCYSPPTGISRSNITTSGPVTTK